MVVRFFVDLLTVYNESALQHVLIIGFSYFVKHRRFFIEQQAIIAASSEALDGAIREFLETGGRRRRHQGRRGYQDDYHRRE